jgi:hypothetical protein
MPTGHHHLQKLEPFGVAMNGVSRRPRNRTAGHLHTEGTASPEVRSDTQEDANNGAADKRSPHQHGVDESLVQRASNARPVRAFGKDLHVAAARAVDAVTFESAACNSPRNMDPLAGLANKTEAVDASSAHASCVADTVGDFGADASLALPCSQRDADGTGDDMPTSMDLSLRAAAEDG